MNCPVEPPHSSPSVHPASTVPGLQSERARAGVRKGESEEPCMINPASFAAPVVALVFILAGPTDGFAQSKINERPHERANPVPRPPTRTNQPSGIVAKPGPIVGPIASPQRHVMPVPSAPSNRVDDHERDHDRDRGAIAAGVAAGMVL